MRLTFYLDGEDKLHEQRVAKCEISTNSETNFYLDEVDKLDERGEQGQNVEKGEVEPLPPQAQRPAYIGQLPKDVISGNVFWSEEESG